MAKLREMTGQRNNLPVDCLIFSEEALEKLAWFRDNGAVEVGALCQTREDDPLYVEKLHFVKQESTAGSTEFDEDAQHNLVVDMDEAGVSPENYLRIWVHTHPGSSATPSSTDWETFDEVFGLMPWSIMAILSKSAANSMYCLFRAEDEAIHIPVVIDTPEVNREEWEAEYREAIHKPQSRNTGWVSNGGYGLYAATAQNPWGRLFPPKQGELVKSQMFKLPKGAGESDKDTHLYRCFYGVSYQNTIPAPPPGWWDHNPVQSAVEALWITAEALMTPKTFARAMEQSFRRYFGDDNLSDYHGIFDPTMHATKTPPKWIEESPYAGLAYLRARYKKRVKDITKAFPEKMALTYDPNAMFEWSKGNDHKMRYHLALNKADKHIEHKFEDQSIDPFLFSIGACLRNEWEIDGVLEAVGTDVHQELNQQMQLDQEFSEELEAQYWDTYNKTWK